MKNDTLLKLGVATFAVATLGVGKIAHAEDVIPNNPVATAAEITTNATTETPKAEETVPATTPTETPVVNEATAETPATNATETPAPATTETGSASETTVEAPKAETPASGEAFNGKTYEPFINSVGSTVGDPNQKIEGYTPIRLTHYFDKSLGEMGPFNYYIFINKKGEFTGEARKYLHPKGAILVTVSYKPLSGYTDIGMTGNVFTKITYDMVEKGQTVFNSYWGNPEEYTFENADKTVSVKTSNSQDTKDIGYIEAKVVTDKAVLDKLPASTPAKDVVLYDIKLKTANFNSKVEEGIITGEATVTAKVDPTRKVEKVFYFLPETGAIEELPFTLSEDGGSVIFKVSHFSNYGVLYADDSVKPTPTPQPTPTPTPTPTPAPDNNKPVVPDNGSNNQVKPTDNPVKPVKPVDNKPAEKPAKKDSKDSTEPAKSDQAEKPAAKTAEPAKTEVAKSAEQAKPATLPNTGESNSVLAILLGIVAFTAGLFGLRKKEK